MALTADVRQQYIRLASQQQVLYTYWLSAGDVARARLSMDVANWYFLQLGIPYYLPTDLIGYTPKPTSPDAAVALAASLPVDAGGPAIAGGIPIGVSSGSGSGTGGRDVVAGARGAGSGSAGAASAATIQGFAINRLSSGYIANGLTEYCGAFPDDPICWSGGGFDDGGDGFGNGPVYISEPVTIVINQNGVTIADVASRIAGALGTAAAAIATAVDSALASAIAGIQHALNAIGNELMSIYRLLSRLLGYVLQFLKGLLLDVIHGLVAAVEEIGKLLKDVIQNVLMPALQALQRLRDYLIKIYERFLRPLLIVLQDIRKVLAILKVFHVGFATKLDNVLADIQAKISAPLLYLLKYTNAIANYINLILDARLFIQKPLFLASLNSYKGSSLNLLINSMNPPPDPAAIAKLQAQNTILTGSETEDAFVRYLKTQTGPLAFPIRVAGVVLNAYIGKNG